MIKLYIVSCHHLCLQLVNGFLSTKIIIASRPLLYISSICMLCSTYYFLSWNYVIFMKSGMDFLRSENGYYIKYQTINYQ